MGSKHPPDVDSPAFRFHDHHHNYHQRASLVVLNSGQWARDEQERFLEALEKHGSGQSTDAAAVWHAITSMVGTRSLQDVKAHAHHYFLQLQIVNSQRRKEYLLMQQVDTRWTLHEDELLEDELARCIASRAVYFPWDEIARRLPGKTPRDARERFQKLCYDITRIETGQHIMMHLGRAPRVMTDAASPDGPSAQPIDCVVTLTPSESRLLFAALEQVSVPPNALPDALAAVASAIAALACSKNRVPPTRLMPLFSYEDACRTLQHAVELDSHDPRCVLQLIVRELRLLPHQSKQDPACSASATTGVAFSSSHSSAFGADCLSPPPKDAEFNCLQPTPTPRRLKQEETRSAEGLLTLRTSPMHSLGFMNNSGDHDDSSRFGTSTHHGTTSFSFPLISTSSPYPAEFLSFEDARESPSEMNPFRM